MFTFIGLLLVAQASAVIIQPYARITLSRQQQGDFIIDINSAESLVYKNGTVQPTEGYNPETAADFKTLNRDFSASLNETVNYSAFNFNGTFAAATVQSCFVMPTTVSFGLVNQTSGDLSLGFNGNKSQSAMGRLGVNPWINAETNLTSAVFGQDGIYGFAVACNYSCFTSQSIGLCKLYGTEQANITVDVKPHENNYWQVEADRVRFSTFTSNRKTNVIFSTTVEDITVPAQLFSLISKSVNATQTTDSEGRQQNTFDCKERKTAKSLYLQLNGTDVEIAPAQYSDFNTIAFGTNCLLRLKVGETQDIVLGTSFYQAYGSCFNAKQKIVQLNRINATETLAFNFADASEDRIEQVGNGFVLTQVVRA